MPNCCHLHLFCFCLYSATFFSLSAKWVCSVAWAWVFTHMFLLYKRKWVFCFTLAHNDEYAPISRSWQLPKHIEKREYPLCESGKLRKPTMHGLIPSSNEHISNTGKNYNWQWERFLSYNLLFLFFFFITFCLSRKWQHQTK